MGRLAGLITDSVLKEILSVAVVAWWVAGGLLMYYGTPGLGVVWILGGLTIPTQEKLILLKKYL